MCESTFFLEEGGEVREIMHDVSRIVVSGNETIVTDVIGQRKVFKDIVFKESNFMSHGIVFVRKA